MARDVLSYCRICAAACGITVTVDGQQVVRVRGDAGHPVSLGYTCAKGRALPAWHHDPGRLDRPRLHGVDVDWDVLLDDLASSLRTVTDLGGADAVALYLATGLAYDAAGQVASVLWLASLGSGSFYTAATVDNAPVLVAAELVAGNAMLSPVWDATSAGLLLLVGTNPVVSHGYGTTLPDPVRHLRDHRRAGGRLWVVDPRRTETAGLADEHLAVRPGSDVTVLAAVARAILEKGYDPAEVAAFCDPAQVEALRRVLSPFTVSRAAAVAGVDAAAIDDLIADVRAHRGRLAVMCGTGTTMSSDGILVEWLRWVLLILTGSLDRAGGMRFQHGPLGPLSSPDPHRGGPAATPAGPVSRPELARVVGQVPAVALADEIEAGRVRALVVTGGNPLGALPEPDRLARALASLEVLAVVDVAESTLTDLATHVLPATGQLERADLMLAANLSVRSGAQATAAVVAPVAQRRPVWWMLGSLATRLGPDLLGADPDSLSDELFLRGLMAGSHLDADAVFEAGPRGLDVEPDLGWVHERMLPGGRWQLAPSELVERLGSHAPPDGASMVLAPRRESAWSNTVRYAGDGHEPLVRLHPVDADAAGLAAGGWAELSSEHGELLAEVAVDPNVRPGVASVSHSRRTPAPGRLTSTRVGADPLTGMPRASGLAVRIRPVDRPDGP